MKLYEQKASGRTEEVGEGFNGWAFLFGFLWFLSKGMIGRAILVFFGMWILSLTGWIGVIIGVIAVGSIANRLYEDYLIKKGYSIVRQKEYEPPKEEEKESVKTKPHKKTSEMKTISIIFRKDFVDKILMWASLLGFGIIIIAALSSFSISSFFSILVSSIGIFIALPHFDKFVKRKFHYRVLTWMKIIGLIVLFFIAIFLLIGQEETSKPQPPVVEQERVSLEDMTPMEVVEQFESYSYFEGVEGNLDSIKSRKLFVSGTALETLEGAEATLNEVKSLKSDIARLVSDTNELCRKLKNFVEPVAEEVCKILQDSSQDAQTAINSWEFSSINDPSEVVIREIVEETEDTVKIRREWKLRGSQINGSPKMVTYTILRKDSGTWKIYDIINESGESNFETLSLAFQEADKLLEKMRESYRELKKIVDEGKKVVDKAIDEERRFNEFKRKLSVAVKKTIPEKQLVTIDLNNYNNQSDKYIVSVTYYFKDELFVDNYLQVMSDASDIFERVFPVSSKIYQVKTIVKEKYSDDYGNTKRRFLARTSMDRKTYNKINWGGFESNNLDNVAQVTFYGDSLYKSLEELEDLSQRFQNMPSSGVVGGAFYGDSSHESLKELQDMFESVQNTPYGGFPRIEGMPASLCDDAKRQCEADGDCEVYELIRSQGMC